MTNRVAFEATFTEQISPGLRKVGAEFDVLAGETQRWSVRHQRAFADAGTAIDRIQVKLAASSRGAGAGLLAGFSPQLLAVGALAAAGAAIGATGAAAIAGAAQLETYRQGFTTLTGSVKTADAELRVLQDIANKSPFNLAGTEQFAQRLTAARVPLEQVNSLLKDTTNISAAFGLDNEKFQRIGVSLSQSIAKGQVYQEELQQLAEAGVPALQILADHYGVTTGKIIEMTKAGQVQATDLIAAFHEYAQDPSIVQAAEAQSKTWQGLTSTVGDLGQQLASTFGTPVLGVFEERLAGVIDYFSQPEVSATLADWGDKAARVAQAMFTLFDEVGRGGAAVLTVLRPITDAIGQLLGSLPAATVSNPIAPLAASMGDLGSAAGEAALLTTNTAEATRALQDRLQGLQQAAQATRTHYEDMITPLKEQERLLDKAWERQNQATSLARLDAKIAQDKLLAQNQYSGAGQAAAQRLVQEQEQRADLVSKQGHDAAKGRIEDKIHGLEQQRDGTLRGITEQERAAQREIAGIQAADRARKAAATAHAAAAAEAARLARLQDQADARARAAAEKLWQEYIRVDLGYQDTTESVKGLLGQLDLLNFFDLSTIKASVDDFLTRWGFNKGGLAGLISDTKLEAADLFAYIDTHAGAVGTRLDLIMSAGAMAAIRLKQAVGGSNAAEDAQLKAYDARVAAAGGAAAVVLGGGPADKAADAAYEARHRQNLRDQAQERGAPGPDEIQDPARRKWLEQQEELGNTGKGGPGARRSSAPLTGTGGAPGTGGLLTAAINLTIPELGIDGRIERVMFKPGNVQRLDRTLSQHF